MPPWREGGLVEGGGEWGKTRKIVLGFEMYWKVFGGFLGCFGKFLECFGGFLG